MISVADILKLLDKVPIWKQLNGLPAQYKNLEHRVQMLEDKLSGKSGDLCPKCGSLNYILESSKPHPMMKEMGFKERIYECKDCNFTESKTIK